MNYYLHRISYENKLSYSLFKNGINGEKYISLGWSNFLDTNILDHARNDDKKAFKDRFDKKTEANGIYGDLRVLKKMIL